MSQKEHGDAGPVLISREQMFDPQGGWFTQEVYRGYRANLEARRALYIDAGWKATIRDTGSQWPELVVQTPQSEEGAVDPTLEQPVDTWNFTTDYVQEDIWRNAEVHRQLEDGITEIGPEGFGSALAEIKRIVELELRRGTSPSNFSDKLPFQPSSRPIIVALYATLQRNQTAIEIEWPVLSRNRSVSTRFLFPSVIDVTPNIYTTSALISTFGIPLIIADRLPANPSFTPDYSVWGWKRRKNDSEVIPSQNKVKEKMEFVFAAWPTIGYQIID